MRNRKTKYTVIDTLVLLAFTAGAGFVYAGFFHPDEFYIERGNPVYLYASLGLRIGFPAAFLVCLLIYHFIKTGRIAPSRIVLSGASFLFAGLLCYPAVNYIYNRSKSFEKHAGAYHPYLQISPQEFQPQESASAAPCRIFCLGGSTTEWRDSLGRGWPERVQETLRISLGRDDIETYNLGREWYTSQHTLINYAVNLREHRPDAILVMHAINDLLHNADFSYFSHDRFRPDYRHFYGPVNQTIAREGLESFCFNLVRRLWYHRPRRTVEQTDFPGIPAFVRNLNTIIDLAERDGTRVIFMTQPHLFKESMNAEELDAIYMINHEAIGPREKWSAATGRDGFRQYNEAVRNLGRERDIAVIDLEPAVPKTLEYFRDDVHYTDRAFDLVAGFVAAELLRQGLIPPAKSE